MKILITGSKGFVGKNLKAELRNQGYKDLLEFHRGIAPDKLDAFTRECGFVFHLAGVNRPEDDKEFMDINFGLTGQILKFLEKHDNKSPIVFASSIQAGLDNPYGKSKKKAEELLFSYSRDTGSKVMVFRLPNIFGKWSKPDYNSVVATFCHNVSRGIDIQVNDPETLLTLCYIDDVLREFVKAIKKEPPQKGKYYIVPAEYKIKLGKLAGIIKGFRDTRKDLGIPDMKDGLSKKLYSTYNSYLPEDDFTYDLDMITDDRGSFTEFIRTAEKGQISVNVIKPGITKGNHWHHTKSEKFMVVYGRGLIQFRKVDGGRVISYDVDGEKFKVVDIPPGYTHNIKNIGDTDMVTVMWANEIYDPDNTDTYYMEV